MNGYVQLKADPCNAIDNSCAKTNIAFSEVNIR